jgi:hypothetical protein
VPGSTIVGYPRSLRSRLIAIAIVLSASHSTVSHTLVIAVAVAHLSFATLLTICVASAAGGFGLFVRMLGESGRLRVSLNVLGRCKADLITVLVYDAFSGLVCAATIVLFGVTRPPALMTGFTHRPLLAWATLGLIGPLVSIWLVDRIPLRPLLDRTSRAQLGGTEAGGTIMSEGRFRASTRIREQLYLAVRVHRGIEADKLRAYAVGLINDGRLSFDTIAEEIKVFASRWGRRVPSELRHALNKRAHWPTGYDPGSDTVLLLYAATAVGWLRPIEVACGRVEGQAVQPPGASLVVHTALPPRG